MKRDPIRDVILAAVVARLRRSGANEELALLAGLGDSELDLLVCQEIDEYIGYKTQPEAQKTPETQPVSRRRPHVTPMKSPACASSDPHPKRRKIKV